MKPVEEVNLTATTEQDEIAKRNSDYLNCGAIVTNAKKRKCKQTVAVSDSVVTESLVSQVPTLDSSYKTPAEAVKNRKHKVNVVSDSTVVLPAQASEVVHSRKRTPKIVSYPVVMKTNAVHSSSETSTELDKNMKHIKSVGVPHAATPVVPAIKEAVNSNTIPVVVSNEAMRTPLMVSGQISDEQQPKHPEATLVPSAIIPSSSKQIEHSESDGDSQMEAEEAAYCQELAKKQIELSKQK